MFKRGILFLTLCFAFASSLEAQVKLSELTKSNMSFKKSVRTSSYDRNDKAYRDSDKRFDTSNYYDSNKSFYDRDKRYSTSNYYDADKRARGYDNTYNSPDLRTLDGKSRFYDQNKEYFIENEDRTLNRDYSGRSDFSRKKNMDDMVDRVYEDLMDRSMSDINKYHSQTAREDSTEGGLPVSSVSGANEESSILDLLDFSTKKIDNSSVKFTLPRSMSHMRTMPADDPSSYNSQAQSESYQGQNPTPPKRDPNIPDYSKGYNSKPQKSQSSTDSKKTYTVDKPVKQDDAPTSIFGVPKEFNSGKVQITVEVKQK